MPSRRSVSQPGGFTVARIAGIPLVIHGSWVISLSLLSLVAYDAIVSGLAPQASQVARLVLSVLFGGLIAGCIVAHELAHCAVARAYGLPVRRITLFAFGGVSQIEKEAPTPAAEYAIAFAGPLASLMLATSLGFVARVLNPGTDSLRGAWGGIAFVNLALAVFNLLPAFPMDGGRILRSGLWGAVRNRPRATRWAVWVGRGFAAGLMGLGVFGLVAGRTHGAAGGLSGVYTFVIGLFIYQAAGNAGAVEGSNDPRHDREEDR